MTLTAKTSSDFEFSLPFYSLFHQLNCKITRKEFLKKGDVKLQSSFKSEKNANSLLNIFNAFILFFPFLLNQTRFFSVAKGKLLYVWL